MKVLQINNVFKTGSTGKIVADIHNELSHTGIESVVCYGRGQKVNEKNIYKVCGELYSKINNLLSRIFGLPYGGCRYSTRQIIKLILKEKPDIVHLHCINSHFVNIYKIIEWLKSKNIKTVLTLHAEFIHTANCSHHFDCEKYKTGCGKCPRFRQATGSWFIDATHKSWAKMKKAFDGFDNLTVVSVSPWLREQAMQSPILKDKTHAVVMNGLDTNAFQCIDASQLKQKHNLTTQKVIFHATPYFSSSPDDIKGGYYLLQLAEKMKDENAKFIVAGEFDKSISSLPKNVLMLGPVYDKATLAQYYSLADVTLLTSRRETFSMVCAESLCCGTPIVGFKAGAPEQISISQFSEFVDFGDVYSLNESVKKFLNKEFDRKEIAEMGQQMYSKERMTKEYLAIYQDMIGRNS
ncbi:MAG: glycosyltransferase [Clostridia bacterium]|nr:glycosyltransferase [Clostridia bacterium]